MQTLSESESSDERRPRPESPTGEFPMHILKLVNFKCISIGCLNLTEIHEEIGTLINLDQFYVCCNRLTSLPSSITKLVNLEKLYAESNHLTELPPDIGSLSKLRILQLHCNCLRTLPESISKLSKTMERLTLMDNPIDEEGYKGELGKSELRRIFGDRVHF